MSQIFILGDSHVIAIRDAIRRRPADRLAFNGSPTLASRFAILKRETGKMIEGVSEEDAFARIQAAGRDATVVSVVGGNQFNVFGMIQHPEPFDFFEPDWPDAPMIKGARLVPVAVIEQLFSRFIGGRDESALKRFQAVTTGRLLHLIPPPPKGDDEFVLRTAELYFQQRDIGAAGVSPASLRLKLWHVQARITERIGERLGIEVVRPPVGITTPEGYLHPDFWGRDATHANIAYGECVVAMLESLSPQTEEPVR